MTHVVGVVLIFITTTYVVYIIITGKRAHCTQQQKKTIKGFQTIYNNQNVLLLLQKMFWSLKFVIFLNHWFVQKCQEKKNK